MSTPPRLYNSLAPYVLSYAMSYDTFNSMLKKLWDIDDTEITKFMNGNGQGANFVLGCYAYPFSLDNLVVGKANNYITLANHNIIVSNANYVLRLRNSWSEPTNVIQTYSITGDFQNAPTYFPSWFKNSSHCNYKIYLPYIGFKEIDNFTANTNLIIQYQVDVTTGLGTCKIYAGSNDDSMLLYRYDYVASYSIPITGADNTIINQANKNAILNISQGGIAAGIGMVTAKMALADPEPNTKMALLGATAIAGVFSGVTQMVKGASDMQDYQKYTPSLTGTSSVSGNTLHAFYTLPYIICEYDDVQDYKGQEHYFGKPCYKDVTVGSLKGYARFANIHIEINNATEPEKEELEQLFVQGVIVNYG